MTRFTLALLVASGALACADSDPFVEPELALQTHDPMPEPDAGDVEKIYRSGNFGVDTATQGQCTATSVYCLGARSKTFRAGFNASTCSSWWQARFVAAEAGMKNLLALYGWTMLGPQQGQTPDLLWACGATGDGGIVIELGGQLPIAPVTWTTLPNGLEWGQPRRGKIWIDSAEIESTPAWANASDGQRKVFAENAIRHETGHYLGLGHSTNSLHVMHPAQVTNPNAFPWAYGAAWTSNELFWLDCYDPTSDTASDC